MSNRKLEPGMWCKPRNEAEWRAVLDLSGVLGNKQSEHGVHLFNQGWDRIWYSPIGPVPCVWPMWKEAIGDPMPELSVAEFIASMYEEAERRKSINNTEAVNPLASHNLIFSDTKFLDMEFLKSLPHVKPNWKRWVREKFKKYGKRIAGHEQRIKALEEQMLEKVSILDHAFEVDKMLKKRIEGLEKALDEHLRKHRSGLDHVQYQTVQNCGFTIAIDPKASPKGIPFSVALEYLKAGGTIRRPTWPADHFIIKRKPGITEFPSYYHDGRGGTAMPWEDASAHDWEVVIPEQQ